LFLEYLQRFPGIVNHFTHKEGVIVFKIARGRCLGDMREDLYIGLCIICNHLGGYASLYPSLVWRSLELIKEAFSSLEDTCPCFKNFYRVLQGVL